MKSLEKLLDGISNLRAASAVAWIANAAAFAGLSLPTTVKADAIIGASILIAVVNVVDGYIRGKHAEALPALIAQGAESIKADVHDPRVDDVAGRVAELANRVAAVEGGPKPASVSEIVDSLIGRAARDAAVKSVVDAAAPAPAAPEAPAPPADAVAQPPQA